MLNSFFRILAVGLLAISLPVLSGCGEEGGSLGESGAGGSSHNSGRDCSSCHGVKYSGTVYQSAGGDVAPNAVIVITESGGSVIEITADNSGNFYSQRGNPSGGYSVTVKGNTVGMISQPTNGNCNVGGCHDGSSTARVYKN